MPRVDSSVTRMQTTRKVKFKKTFRKVVDKALKRKPKKHVTLKKKKKPVKKRGPHPPNG